MKTYGISGTSAAAPKAPAQDLDRHVPRPAANHLTQPEQVRRDALMLDDDVAALHALQAARPMKPPTRRP